MKFNQMVAVVATLLFVAGASAQENGGVVILNTNTNSNNSSATAAQSLDNSQGQTQTAVAQPTTVVEATTLSESRAESMRKARQDAELSTEQRIVEKLEDSRLQDERMRAERLFGNRLEAQQTATATATQNVNTVVEQKAEPKTEPKAEPAVEAKAPVQQVIIEKVEIVQPAPVEAKPVEVAPVATTAEPTIVENKSVAAIAEEPAAEVKPTRFYVSGNVGNMNYDAKNVKSNYGLGVSVGLLLQTRWAVEAGYFFSNHYVDTFWQYAVYRVLNQHDISASTKFYILEGKLKPYVGAGITYIYRSYDERVKQGYAWNVNQSTESVSSHSLDGGITGGLDFLVTDRFMIGGGIEYSMNMMNSNPPNWGTYGLPEGSQPLETLSHYTIKVGAKYVF